MHPPVDWYWTYWTADIDYKLHVYTVKLAKFSEPDLFDSFTLESVTTMKLAISYCTVGLNPRNDFMVFYIGQHAL